MSTTRFATGKEFTWQGDLYTVKRLLPGLQLHIENAITGQVRTASFQELVEALVARQLLFPDNGNQAAGATGGCIDLSDYPNHLRAIAEYRLAVIKPLLTLRQIGKEAVLARIQTVRAEQEKGIMPQLPLSLPSIYRWLRDYARGDKIFVRWCLTRQGKVAKTNPVSCLK